MTLNPKSWRNADGLDVWFGTAEGQSGLGGEQVTLGDNRVQEFVLTLTDLTSSAQYLDEHFELPKGAFIEQVELVVLTAATGSSSTLSIGLSESDDSTNISDTALVSALALSSINTAGDKVTLNVGSTSVGSSVGTALSVNGLVTAKYGTAAFTAGKIAVRVYYNFVK